MVKEKEIKTDVLTWNSNLGQLYSITLFLFTFQTVSSSGFSTHATTYRDLYPATVGILCCSS